jgi:transmembrane sensor
MAVDLDALARRARERMEPEWNEVREQRVLAAVQKPRPVRRAPVGWMVAAGTLSVAAAALLAVLVWPEEPAAVAGSRLELHDGSVCTLDEGARVRVAEQAADRVRLEQEGGRVHYDVSHRPGRSFEVQAAPVTVRVRGTRFAVAVSDDAVRVVVEEGRVEVEARGQVTALAAGDALQVSRQAPRAEAAPEPVAVPPREPAPVATAPDEAPTASAAPPPRPRRTTESTANEPVEPAAEPLRAPSAAELLAEADAHRRAGRAVEAATALERLLTAHPNDAHVASAAFTLGRLRRRLGRPAAAAEAFERAWRAAPNGPLAEDALAEEAQSWADASEAARAATAAQRYLQQHPEGLHAPRMRALIQP